MIEIIVLNFNSLDKLAYCLESIKQYTKVEHTVTVIDNKSTDGSAEWLKIKGYKVVENPINLYYTVGYARYLKTAKLPEYFVLMNNDCVVTPGWDKALVDFMDNNPKCGICAPMLTDMTGRQVQNMGGMGDFYGHKGGVPEQWKAPEKNWWTTFACVMVRKEAFDKVGGFDLNLRFYCSDSDLCLRMILSGYEIFNIPESKVRHFHMASTKKNMSPELRQIMAQDQSIFEGKWEWNGVRNKPEPVMEHKL